MTYANFGDFISRKRIEKKITIRKMADMLGVSAPFLTDVEKDRRNPFDIEKLNQLAHILELTKEEKNEMLNLAGKKRKAVAPDLPEYIMQRDYVSAALRTARDLDAGEEEWKISEHLKKDTMVFSKKNYSVCWKRCQYIFINFGRRGNACHFRLF